LMLDCWWMMCAWFDRDVDLVSSGGPSPSTTRSTSSTASPKTSSASNRNLSLHHPCFISIPFSIWSAIARMPSKHICESVNLWNVHEFCCGLGCLFMVEESSW
jgi:hypothetical protein